MKKKAQKKCKKKAHNHSQPTKKEWYYTGNVWGWTNRWWNNEEES